MKRTKILTILFVGVISVSLQAEVVEPPDAPKGKGWDQVWDALLNLQGQINSLIDEVSFEFEELGYPFNSSYRYMWCFFVFGPLAFLTSAEYGTGSAAAAC
jgi:hypothetical protein